MEKSDSTGSAGSSGVFDTFGSSYPKTWLKAPAISKFPVAENDSCLLIECFDNVLPFLQFKHINQVPEEVVIVEGAVFFGPGIMGG